MDRGRRLAPGDVVLVRLPEQQPPGHEQTGLHPALVVAIPERLSHPRFPVVLVAPFTTDRGQPWADKRPALYPRIPQA